MDSNELMEIKEAQIASAKPIRLRCCLAAGCLYSEGEAIKEALENALEEEGLTDQVEVLGVGCMGLCSEGPLVQVDPDGILYEKVKPSDARSIVAALKGGKATAKIGDLSHPFFTKQVPVVLENSGKVDPERIETYIARDGYQALNTVINELHPSQVVEEVTKSGLRGRGGAGYRTGLKWELVAKTPGDRKYVVCNADEGDPGAFMDRSVLESDPHRVLEGMAIAAYAVGANQGYIYVRGEYPLCIKRLQIAIRQARNLGLLGSAVFDTSFNFRVDLRIGAGAFVCGEETALMASIEGRRGTPRPRPPFPAESGLWNSPTLINNVETYANIPLIIRKGAAWFSSMGTERSKGTKVFSLAGKVKHTGLIEVPMGTPLRVIVNEMAGGAPDGGKVKAVYTGGLSGGCIPAEKLDTPVDYESLVQIGAIMGSGGMIVMDETDNMVDLAHFFMEFCVDESCGKCVPCRAGTVQIYRLLDRILNGMGEDGDIAKLQELSEMVKSCSLCGLGQSAPNPVVSTLRYYRNEYIECIHKNPKRNGNKNAVKAAK